MTSLNWKNAAELVGMVAIVASLIFVGLELRQSHDIALTDSGWSRLLSEIESRRAIYQFPEIWAKGNAGEELNPAETVIYRTLIRDLNTLEYHKYSNAIRLDNENASDMARRDLAGFLFENPGARREWELLREEFRRYREPHTPGEYSNDFENAVRADLEVLEKMNAQ